MSKNKLHFIYSQTYSGKNKHIRQNNTHSHGELSSYEPKQIAFYLLLDIFGKTKHIRLKNTHSHGELVFMSKINCILFSPGHFWDEKKPGHIRRKNTHSQGGSNSNKICSNYGNIFLLFYVIC